MDLLSGLLAVGHTWWLGGKSEPTGLMALFLRAIGDGRERVPEMSMAAFLWPGVEKKTGSVFTHWEGSASPSYPSPETSLLKCFEPQSSCI